MTEGDSRPSGMFRVAFDLEQVNATWPPFYTERIWAKKGSAPYQLELQNIPFFVRGLSCGDIIRAKPDHERRELVFDGLVRHSGRSTIRIILRDKSDDTRGLILGLLDDAGCAWEFSSVDFHLAADIPQDVNYNLLRSRLVTLVSEGIIEVEEAFVADQHKAHTDS